MPQRPSFAILVSVLLIAFAAVPARAQSLVWRINCGGNAEIAPSGPPFMADVPYSPGGAGYVKGNIQSVLLPIGGAGNSIPIVTQTAREGWREYRFDVPNGAYVVRMTFAEVDSNVQGPGLRKFDIRIQGVPFLTDLDIASRVGIQYSTECAAAANVSNGHISISASMDKDPSLLNAIEVWNWPADSTGPAAPPSFAAKPGFHRNILTWAPSPAADVSGYIIVRSDAASGPFVPIASVWPAPARFLDESAPVGTTVYYQIVAADVFGNAGAPTPAVSCAAMANADSPAPVYQLAVDPANIKILDQSVFTDPYAEVPAVFTYKGQSHDVEVRYRGANSRRYSKKGWKIKFSENDLFQGVRELNLKAHYEDFSMAREPAAAWLYDAAGQAVSTHRAARLEINGVDRGVFDSVEQVDEFYLSAHGRDTGGSVYEVGAPFVPLPNPSDYELFYDKKTNKNTGYDDLIAFIQTINFTPAPVFDTTIAGIFDVDGYLTYLAVIGWLGDGDSVLHNAMLLDDLSLGRWEMIPWDTDLGFGAYPFSTTTKTDYSIDFGAAGSPDEPTVGSNILKTRILGVPAFRWRYCEKLKALMAGPVAPAALGAAIDAYSNSNHKEASADVAKWGWESDDLYNSGPGILKSYIPARTAFLQSQLQAYEPSAPPTAIWINEIMADNASTVADEAGEYDDWLELYNSTSLPFDAGGMILTDDIASQTGWRIPAGTTIPPQGYLRIWCDNDPAQGPFHATFKLKREGETLALFDSNGQTMRDFIAFGPQAPDVSFGRFPDGGAFFQYFGQPTPGAANTNIGNLPPKITGVHHAPVAPTPADSVTIQCITIDSNGVAGVVLSWRISGGIFQSASMAAVEANLYQIIIPPQPTGTTVEYYIEAQDGLGKHAVEPSHAPQDLYSYTSMSPVAGAIRINELMADNASTFADEFGQFDDWIELYNSSNASIDVGGMYLTDDLTKPKKWKIPAGTSVGAKSTLLFWADGTPAQGPLHTNFKFDKQGESAGLFDSDANLNGFLDGFSFGLQTTDVSLGLLPDGGPVRVKITNPSPGHVNIPAQTANVAYDLAAPAASSIHLSPAGSAHVGQTFHYLLSGGPPNASGYALFGGDSLLLDVPPYGTLLINPEIYTTFTTDNQGNAAPAVDVPNDPFFVNFTFYAQVYIPGAGLSSAVASTIGP
ncbi:MAG: CotH kinase family protein [Planctomycetes bacterium]|nr:CotH kinase family protein [Planctomycetota bacterium]